MGGCCAGVPRSLPDLSLRAISLERVVKPRANFVVIAGVLRGLVRRIREHGFMRCHDGIMGRNGPNEVHMAERERDLSASAASANNAPCSL